MKPGMTCFMDFMKCFNFSIHKITEQSLGISLQYICGWLKLVSKNHFEVILSCLLPHPVDYARVGGYW